MHEQRNPRVWTMGQGIHFLDVVIIEQRMIIIFLRSGEREKEGAKGAVSYSYAHVLVHRFFFYEIDKIGRRAFVVVAAIIGQLM